jgi:hypothetical protein
MRRTLLGLAALALAAIALPTLAGAGSTGGFVNFELAGWPSTPAGVTCPGSDQCMNFASEPQIRAAKDGAFFASSENGVTGGTNAWRSTDGGRHYTSLPCPNCGSETNTTGFAPGGGDTDVAIAPEKNAAGFYNVYIASLTLANITLSTSTDGGGSWNLSPVTTPETADDREWVAVDGVSKVCISYHNGPQGITVGCSPNAGLTFTQWSPALDANHAFQTGENLIGNLAIDAPSDIIYQVYSAITTAAETACAPQLGVIEGTCDAHGVYVAVSTDGGLTFTDYPVYVNPDPSVGYGHQFVNVSVDKSGNVYAVYTDNHHVYYSFSTDRARTWKGPFRISKTGTNIMPWSTAGDAGKLDVVYYKTPYYDGTTIPDNYPMSAAWTVGFAQNLNALKPGSSWTEQTATPIIHYGGACESGVTCTGNRDLVDDFGVAASPTTGFASIIYSDDQYRNDKNYKPESSCTPTATNTQSCDKTVVATQTSGNRIFTR